MKIDNSNHLKKVRELFNLAHVDQKNCNELTMLASQSNDFIHKAYYAAALMISAKYQLNPFKKISLFNEGKTLLEDIISEHFGEPEIHFIRYTIQLNTPAFLGYSRSIAGDRDVLKEFLKGEAEETLRLHMGVFITDTKDELSSFL